MGNKTMERMYRGGPWYVVDFRKMEFLKYTARREKRPDTQYATWTPRICWARKYKNPSAALRVACTINSERGRHDCQALGYEAAQCVDGINRRDGLPGRARANG